VIARNAFIAALLWAAAITPVWAGPVETPARIVAKTRSPPGLAVPSHIDREAERFVRLALALGQARPPEVDGYFGPARLRPSANASSRPLAELLRDSTLLLTQIERSSSTASSPRREALLTQARSLNGLLQVLEDPAPHAFEDEARLIYGISLEPAPAPPARRYVQDLESLLPGPGPLARRVEAFRNQFIIPAHKRKAVFERALQECRSRTLAQWRLPPGEKLTVEWTRDVDAAWHQYSGHGRSTLRLNDQAVAFIGSAIDVACHEGYPGHHAQFVLLESRTPATGVAVEQTVVLLRSPASMLREGAAEYGVELAFDASERLKFERDVLFPLAGLDPQQAQKYRRVHELERALARSVVPILRDYRDKRLAPQVAAQQLTSMALIASPEPLLQFTDALGAYVLGYTLAHERVRDYIHRESVRSKRDSWSVLQDILVEMRLDALEGSAPQRSFDR
jgi:hypothetical protein